MNKKIHVMGSLLLLLISTISFAQPKEKYEFKKERTINKTYAASGNKLSINNSFGYVKVKTVSGNEIKVDISIEVTANNQEMAEHVFENIEVADKQNGNNILFKTTLDSKKKNKDYSCKNCKNTLQINYEVSLPANVPLDIENVFGDIVVPDYTAPISLTSKFGKLEAGKLSSVKDINVEFGSAEIKSAANIEASFKFSKVNLGNLTGVNKLNIEFCDVSRVFLDNNLGSLTVNQSYSTLNIMPPSSLGADYRISTSFGSVDDRAKIGITRTDKPDRYGPDSNREYSGQTGNGQSKIEVKTSFGDVIIGEPAPGTLEKKKNRSSGKGSANAGSSNKEVI